MKTLTETVTLADVYKSLIAIDVTLVLILIVLVVWWLAWLWRGRK